MKMIRNAIGKNVQSGLRFPEEPGEHAAFVEM